MDLIRWGVLSTARITAEFVKAVRAGERSDVRAIASRNASRAAEGARRLGIETSFGSYDALLASSEVDAVYVALPNSMHAEWTIRALDAGKHVLCEKPMALKVEDVESIFDASDRSHRIVMEGFMFCQHPLTKKAAELATAGTLGEIVTVRAWHGFTVEAVTDIRYSRSLGGGALADLGCYCVAGVALVVSGAATNCVARQTLATSGVDLDTHAVVEFRSGATAMLDCSMRVPESAGFQIVGTTGQIEIMQPWFPHLSPTLWLVDRAGRREPIDCPGEDSYVLEVENFCRAVNGEEEPEVGRDLSHRVVETLELIAASARQQSHTASA